MDGPTKKAIGIVVLAAGAARRMNTPKQLLRFEGRSLVRRAAETAVSSAYAPIVVVLGAHFDETRRELAGFPIEIVRNEEWAAGLSSSIRIGIENLLRIEPQIAAAMITLADQPFVEADKINLFAEKYRSSENLIVAASYRATTGVPALFARELFGELARLSGDRGAKALIEKHRGRLSTIDLPEAAVDIDTPEDYRKLLSHEQTRARH